MAILGYQVLSMTSSMLTGSNKEFDDSAIFLGVLLIVGLAKLHNIEDSSFIILGYQVLPLATSKLMGDDMEF